MSSFPLQRTLILLLRDVPVPERDRERLDPAAWTELVRGHHLAGVVHRLLMSDGDRPWPQEIVQGLKEVSRKTLADNMVLLRALHSIDAVLRGLGVHFVLLKGASLLGFLYPEIQLRPMTDLDLLIRKKDWPQVAAALRERGYRLPTEEQESFYGETWYHQLVETPEFPSCYVEFHWNIESEERSRIDPEELRARAVPCIVDGAPFFRLSDDDLLLHLAVHLAHHHEQPSLHWVEDICRLLEKGTLDWAAIEARAGAWRVRNCLAYAFAYVDRIRPGCLPGPARSFTLSRARGHLLRALASADPTLLHRPLAGSPLRHLVSMILLDRWWDAARYVAVHSVLRLGRTVGLARRAPGAHHL